MRAHARRLRQSGDARMVSVLGSASTADLGVRGQAEMLVDLGNEACECGGRQQRRSAAAEMHMPAPR